MKKSNAYASLVERYRSVPASTVAVLQLRILGLAAELGLDLTNAKDIAKLRKELSRVAQPKWLALYHTALKWAVADTRAKHMHAELGALYVFEQLNFELSDSAGDDFNVSKATTDEVRRDLSTITTPQTVSSILRELAEVRKRRTRLLKRLERLEQLESTKRSRRLNKADKARCLAQKTLFEAWDEVRRK